MPEDDAGPSLEPNLDISDATAPPPPPPPRKFKVISDGYSATISLDEAWQAKPFLQGVVKPLVIKLNRRADKEPVSAERLERVEVDGVDVAIGFITKTRSAAEVVPASAQAVELFFGLAPPEVLKFKVKNGGASSGAVEFTITLDKKFMQKTFFDAVVVPYVTMANKRILQPYDAQGIVEVHVDGQKQGGSLATGLKKTALAFLGRHPGVVELFFSWEAVERQSKGKEYSRLQFKVACSDAAEMQKANELEYDHSELNGADGVELGKKLLSVGPLKKLKYLFLSHNELGDHGIIGLAQGLTKTNCPILKKLHLSHNRISSVGIKGFAETFDSEKHVCPDLAQLDLEDNYLTDDGCTALALAIAHGHLVAHELWLAGNPAITPGKRGAMKSELGSPGAPYKSIVSFTPSATGSPFHEDGTISDRTGGRI